MHEIEWLRSASDMPYEIPLPRFSIPGAILGLQNSRDLGTLEFLSSDANNLILVARKQKVIVISPNDPDGFQMSFRRFAELGSIAPIEAHSSNAEFLITTLAKDKYARGFILSGLILSLVLLITVSFIIPAKTSILLGFNPASDSIEPAPSERLLLLPIAALFMTAVDNRVGIISISQDWAANGILFRFRILSAPATFFPAAGADIYRLGILTRISYSGVLA